MNEIFYVLSAFALGALHALEPGHGKTVVAAYLVGSKGRVRDAIALGGIVTFTHTFSIIVLGLLTAVAAAYLVPETVHEALEVVSGLLIVGVGLWMINDRILKGRAEPVHDHSHDHEHDGHRHGLDHDRTRDHDQAHRHAQDEVGQTRAVTIGSRDAWSGHSYPHHLHTYDHHHHGQFGHAHEHGAEHHEGEGHEHAALSLVGASLSHAHGAVTHAHPLPAGETHHHHPELERGFAESHPHDDPAHEHGHVHDHAHEPHDDHDHTRGHGHSHGTDSHSHTLPPGEKPSLGTLLTLGISGGMVPCPAALALLLAAAAAGNILGGVSLVVVFSLGLAVVLIAIGIAMVKAASLAGRYLGDGLTDRISEKAGAVSAVVVTLLGLAMTGRAILDVASVRLF